MKGKNAFAHSSTGYGRKQNWGKNANTNASSSGNNNNNNTKDQKKDTKTDEKNQTEKVDTDINLNSGFGDYLRSGEGVEMMKLFVFANSIMLILTMAWPSIKEQYYWFMNWWYDYQME